MTRRWSSPIAHFILSGATLALYGLSRVAFNALGFRHFGAEAVGAVNVAMSTAVLISMPATAGLGPAYTRYVALSEDETRNGLFAWTVTLLLPMVVLLGAVCLVPALTPLPAFTALWVGLYSFYSLGRADQFARNRPAGAVVLEITSFVLFLIGIFLSASWRLPPGLAFSLYFLPMGLYCLRLLVGSGRFHRPAPGFWSFALVSLLGSLPSLGVLYGSTIAMSRVGGLAAAGVWAALVSLISPVLLVPRTLNSVFLPKLAAASPSSASADGSAWSALTGSHRRLAAALSPVIVCLALGLAGPLMQATVDRTPTRTEFLWWLMIVLSMYAAVRLEPLITCLAALGRNGVATAASFCGGAVCGAVWIAAETAAIPTLIPLGYLLSAVARLLTLQLLLARRRDASVLKEGPTSGDVVVLAASCAYGMGQPLLVLTVGSALAVFLCWREVLSLREVFTTHQQAFRVRG